ncbi:hypothetical protein N9V96_00755 [Polaribacter sp.]|nr:hypothetical protein [Polaribacter sp.]
MEENKHDRQLDTFTKKYVKEIEIEKTSMDFTALVMDKILEENVAPVTFKTKPLISKLGWFCIVFSIIALILIPFQSSEKSWLNFTELNFSFFNKFQITNFVEVNPISNIVLLAILIFGLLIITQILFLKNHFSKRFF